MTTNSKEQMKVDNATRRSPIKGPINRQAGQSIREHLNEYLDDNALLAVLPLGFMLWWLFIELVDRYSKQATSIWLIVVLVVLATINCLYRIRKIKIEAKLKRLGLNGEQYVAQIIERDLLPKGYRVLHDIVLKSGERKFNIDHLLIGSNGVFCIETKTWSKPMRGETIAVFDGQRIMLNGKVRQLDAVGQACALSNEVSLLIKKVTGISITVVPVIVVVGWYVRKGWTSIPKVLVVNEEALAPFVENVQGSLSDDCIERIVQHVSSMISSNVEA